MPGTLIIGAGHFNHLEAIGQWLSQGFIILIPHQHLLKRFWWGFLLKEVEEMFARVCFALAERPENPVTVL